MEKEILKELEDKMQTVFNPLHEDDKVILNQPKLQKEVNTSNKTAEWKSWVKDNFGKVFTVKYDKWKDGILVTFKEDDKWIWHAADLILVDAANQEPPYDLRDMREALKISNEIRDASSVKAKKELLTNNKVLLLPVLSYAYDSQYKTGISDKKITKEVSYGYYKPLNTFGSLMNYLTANNSGTDKDIAVCQLTLNQYPDDIKEFLSQIVTKSLTIGCGVTTINKALGLTIPEWKVQQAYPLESTRLKKGEWFALSEKLNGIRGTYYQGKMYSRQGKEIKGLNHIITEIRAAGMEHMVLDGELRRRNIDHISDNENFRIGTGILNSEDSDKSCIAFTIYDILSEQEFYEQEGKLTYRHRMRQLMELKDVIEERGLLHIGVVDMLYNGTDTNQIKVCLDKMVAEDKEGCMLNRDVVYKCKRHKGILKVKRFYTSDLEIIRAEEGSGKYKGVLGALVVDFNGNEVSVGSGFTDDDRTNLWQIRDTLPGRIAEVKFKEVSEDKKTHKASLQFPIFISLREEGKEVNIECMSV